MTKEIVKKEKDIILDGFKYKKSAFMIEEHHPAIGRILIIEDMKFKILDDDMEPVHKSGTYIKRMTEEDEEHIIEYDEALEELSEKLVDRIDLKRMIKENIKNKPLQDIKTGLFILSEKAKGKKIEEEHHKGCYNYKMHYGSQTFELMTGHDIIMPRGI